MITALLISLVDILQQFCWQRDPLQARPGARCKEYFVNKLSTLERLFTNKFAWLWKYFHAGFPVFQALFQEISHEVTGKFMKEIIYIRWLEWFWNILYETSIRIADFSHVKYEKCPELETTVELIICSDYELEKEMFEKESQSQSHQLHLYCRWKSTSKTMFSQFQTVDNNTDNISPRNGRVPWTVGT